MSKKIRLKGLNVPRIFIWLLGFIHGHIFKIAVVDPDTGLISSGYVAEKCKLYNKLNADYVKMMEDEMKALRNEAAALMADEALLRKEIGEIRLPKALETIEDKRAAKTAAGELSLLRDKYKKTLSRLIEIDEKIKTREVVAREELDSTASALQALFAVYGRGMLLRPLRDNMIPLVEYEKSFEMYYLAHADKRQRLANILKEVYENA